MNPSTGSSSLISRRIAPMLLTAAVVPLLLAGCSAGASADPIPGAPASQGTAAAAPAKPVADTGDGLCAQVSVAAANAAVRSTPAITDQEASTFTDGEPECGFASDDSKTVIVVATVFDGKKHPFQMSSGELDGAALAPVSGLGDRAGVNSDELDIARGTEVLTIENFGSTDLGRDQLIALGRLFAAHL